MSVISPKVNANFWDKRLDNVNLSLVCWGYFLGGNIGPVLQSSGWLVWCGHSTVSWFPCGLWDEEWIRTIKVASKLWYPGRKGARRRWHFQKIFLDSGSSFVASEWLRWASLKHPLTYPTLRDKLFVGRRYECLTFASQLIKLMQPPELSRALLPALWRFEIFTIKLRASWRTIKLTPKWLQDLRSKCCQIANHAVAYLWTWDFAYLSIWMGRFKVKT
jgi:hypothetical protein